MALPGEVTDLSRITDEDIQVDTADGGLRAYLARPSDGRRAPGIIVIHEAFGLVPHIRDVARRFANLGYNALAPDLYTRVGSPDPTDVEDYRPKMFGLHDASVVRDLEGCADHLRGIDGATDKVGCVGFCSGGRQTLLFACSSDRVDAAVDCWGGWVKEGTPDAATSPSRPVPIVDLLGDLRCPLWVIIGEEDQNPSPEVGAEMRERLRGSPHVADVRIYDGAGHAFMADYRPTYRERPAFRLWDDMVGFLGQHLG